MRLRLRGRLEGVVVGMALDLVVVWESDISSDS